MTPRRQFLLAGGGIAAAVAGALISPRLAPRTANAAPASGNEVFAVAHSDEEWRARLTPAQYRVLRQEGTERAYTSPLNDEHRPGIFHCAGCEQALFSSETKFDSRTGWPSFWKPLDGAVGTRHDGSFAMQRTEVHCSRCGGHLGHVFNDGPRPTGLRYCMNGVAMTFNAAAA